MREPISEETEAKVIKLYKADELSIKEIMRSTGVRSEQTVYSILSRNQVPLKSVRTPVTGRRSISFDRDVWEAIKDQKNLSKFVNKAVRNYLKIK